MRTKLLKKAPGEGLEPLISSRGFTTPFI